MTLHTCNDMPVEVVLTDLFTGLLPVLANIVSYFKDRPGPGHNAAKCIKEASPQYLHFTTDKCQLSNNLNCLVVDRNGH